MHAYTGVIGCFKVLQDASKLASESQNVAGARPQTSFGDFHPPDLLVWPFFDES